VTLRKLKLNREVLRKLEEKDLKVAAGGLPITGLCAYSFQLPRCLNTRFCG